jgi:zinc transport system ATP-binding protein
MNPVAPHPASTAAAPPRSGNDGPIIEFDNVHFTYPGAERPALEAVTLSVARGERLGVLGPNGGGKSTLLKLLLGLLRPTSGRVLIEGQPAARARRLGRIGYVPQRPETELGMPLSVRQVVELGASWRLPAWRAMPEDLHRRVARLLDLVGLRDVADRPIGALSGGQMQRALIARALAGGPSILALDEPTVGIDAAGQAVFGGLLRDLHRELDLTILIVSHDLRAIAAGCDRVACLSRRLHFHDSPAGLTPDVLAELFSHDLAGLLGEVGPVHIHAHPAGACVSCTDSTTEPSAPHGPPALPGRGA